MLGALGARFISAQGEIEAPGALGLLELTAIDLSGLDPRLPGMRFSCATDVDNPLLGPSGAASIFGPQKGATPDDVARIEAALSILVAATGSSGLAAVPGAGAAGGTAFGAMLVLGAQLTSGAEFIASASGPADRAASARAVIVGEGRLDRQTLGGKGPAYLARLAADSGVPSFAIAGQVALGEDDLRSIGIRCAIPLSALAQSVEDAIESPAHYIHRAALQLAPML